MKKLLTTFKVLAVFSVLLLNSCRDENNETAQQESVQAKVSTADLKKETTPVSAVIPETVQAQLNESQKNIEKYLKNDLQVTAIS